MKHNFMAKMASALLAVVLSTAAFSVTAFASGGEETTVSVAEQETAEEVSDLLSALAGSQVTVSVTEDGIQFSSGENDSGQIGTVTTGGGNLNVRTGAGMDYTAFTQLPNGTTVKVIGTDGDWLKGTGYSFFDQMHNRSCRVAQPPRIMSLLCSSTS